MPKNILDNLKVDEKLLKPEAEPDWAEAEDDLTLPRLATQDTKSSLPAHIKRSHKKEEDEWNYIILPTASVRLSLKAGSEAQARLKRNKLYNARTYLKYVHKIQHEQAAYTGPLDDWTLVLENKEGVWYIVALNISVDEWIEE
jgi:hypothetical protein